jgi:hypothetical protein
MERVIDTLIYNFQDCFKPLKDIQKRAALVPESEDAALAEERYSGKVRARTDEFEARRRDPLIKAIHESGWPTWRNTCTPCTPCTRQAAMRPAIARLPRSSRH